MVVIAWNASQTKMIRASSGISSPCETVGVALAVVALVAGADDRPHVLELLDRSQDPLPELGMGLDQLPLLVGQRPGLRQDRGRDPDLADVVEERSELDPLQRSALEPELLADFHGHVPDPARVGRRVLVLRLERVGERLDGREEGALEALEGESVRESHLRLAGDPGEQLELALVEVVVCVECERERGPTRVEPDRRDRIRVGESVRQSLADEMLKVRRARR